MENFYLKCIKVWYVLVPLVSSNNNAKEDYKRIDKVIHYYEKKGKLIFKKLTGTSNKHTDRILKQVNSMVETVNHILFR